MNNPKDEAAFDEWWTRMFPLSDTQHKTSKIVWEAACIHKQKEVDALRAEIARLKAQLDSADAQLGEHVNFAYKTGQKMFLLKEKLKAARELLTKVWTAGVTSGNLKDELFTVLAEDSKQEG
jgi:hypothetical protein